MHISFEKYHGTGNDFVIIDNRQFTFPAEDLTLISKICHRHTGVGSDGLMLIQTCEDADFEMVFFNPDGSKSLCGNGSRCAVQFAFTEGMIKSEGTMRTTDGLHDFKVSADRIVSIEMRPVTSFDKIEGHWFIDSGSPHLILDVANPLELDIIEIGRRWRNDKRFESINGTNVNFMAMNSETESFNVRTYERGVENETLSCGTGVTAMALALALEGKVTDSAALQTKGGMLNVKFKKEEKSFTNIWLEGPAVHVFSGVIDA